MMHWARFWLHGFKADRPLKVKAENFIQCRRCAAQFVQAPHDCDFHARCILASTLIVTRQMGELSVIAHYWSTTICIFMSPVQLCLEMNEGKFFKAFVNISPCVIHSSMHTVQCCDSWWCRNPSQTMKQFFENLLGNNLWLSPLHTGGLAVNWIVKCCSSVKDETQASREGMRDHCCMWNHDTPFTVRRTGIQM